MKKFLLISGGVIAAVVVILLLIPLPENQTREYRSAQARQAMQENMVTTGYEPSENVMCTVQRMSPEARETMMRLMIDKEGAGKSELRNATRESFNALEACGASYDEIGALPEELMQAIALGSLYATTEQQISRAQ